jgi:hypothetical protein
MSKELELLQVLSNDVKKEVGDNDFVNDEWETDFNIIKQALIDKDNRIKDLEKYKLFEEEVKQALCNCLDEEDESFALDNVEKAYNKLIKSIKESDEE